MKIVNKLILIPVIALLSACYEDLGNYTYTDAEVITITGIEAAYDKVSQTDKITLNPDVTSTDPNADFQYFWGIYETNVQGYAPKVDTLLRTKQIDYLVTQPAKGWVLVFGAKNKKSGLMKIVTSNINVITPFTRGWYVLKDNGTDSDIDLYYTPSTILPSGVRENVFSEQNGRKLAGKAQLFTFFSDYKSAITGTLGNTKTLFAMTDKDASGLYINTMKELRGFNTLFYETPSVQQPNAIFQGSSANYFINNGKLHSIYSMSANTGQFGYQQMRDEVGSNYNLSKYFLTYFVSDPLFFDETSSSFVSAGGAGTQLNKVNDGAGTAMPANNNNKTMLFMGTSKTSPYTGYAVFADKTTPSRKIISTLTGMPSALKIVSDTLKTTDKIYEATRFAINQDETMVYFLYNNQIWSRNMANRFEQLQFTVPAGETVTFLRHRKWAPTGADAPYAFNYVMVGTKSGTAYKVRMFTKTAGNLSTTPAFTLEGQGAVGDVIYIAPATSYTTYINSF